MRFIHITFKQYDRITKQKTSKILKQKITKFPKLVVYYIHIKYGLSKTYNPRCDYKHLKQVTFPIYDNKVSASHIGKINQFYLQNQYNSLQQQNNQSNGKQ